MVEREDPLHNVYARNIKGEDIHISEAKSGRKGYFCMGCGKEMQAVKAKKIMEYFRHDPKDIKKQDKCTFSDETYRHKLGKDILQQLKKIKVPALYKYGPRRSDYPNKLQDSKNITASRVSIELSFYEDNAGNIKHSKEGMSHDHLLIRPDVTFFDADGKPILFIELVATHKVTQDKKVKIRRLGIDTIQVRIPKGSPSEIEETFSKTNRTKWVYNNVEASTDYIPVPGGNTTEVLSIDEYERKLLEETFSCRAAEIGNLVRSLSKCLASEPYQRIERSNRSELQRVERNARGAKQKLDRKQREIKEEVESEFARDIKSIGERRTKLEQRYYRKRDFLKREEEEVISAELLLDERVSEEEKGIGTEGRSFKDRRTDLENRRATIVVETGRIERSKVSVRESGEQLPERFETLDYAEQERYNQEVNRISEEEEQLSKGHRKAEKQLRKDFETRRRRITEQVKRRDLIGNDEFSRRIKALDKDRQIAIDFEQEIEYFKRIRAAYDYFRTGSWKSW